MLARITAARRLPQLFAVRHMSLGGRSEGSVASSREFGKKEKAHEDSYVHQHEAEQIKKLAEEIKKKKSEVAELEKQHEQLSNKSQ